MTFTGTVLRGVPPHSVARTQHCLAAGLMMCTPVLVCVCCTARRLYGLAQQASAGDNTTERPMWAEKGGLDFEGRARWDAWAAVKGLEAEQAK